MFLIDLALLTTKLDNASFSCTTDDLSAKIRCPMEV